MTRTSLRADIFLTFVMYMTVVMSLTVVTARIYADSAADLYSWSHTHLVSQGCICEMLHYLNVIGDGHAYRFFKPLNAHLLDMVSEPSAVSDISGMSVNMRTEISEHLSKLRAVLASCSSTEEILVTTIQYMRDFANTTQCSTEGIEHLHKVSAYLEAFLKGYKSAMRNIHV